MQTGLITLIVGAFLQALHFYLRYHHLQRQLFRPLLSQASYTGKDGLSRRIYINQFCLYPNTA
jgi:hypothetical protein